MGLREIVVVLGLDMAFSFVSLRELVFVLEFFMSMAFVRLFFMSFYSWPVAFVSLREIVSHVENACFIMFCGLCSST